MKRMHSVRIALIGFVLVIMLLSGTIGGSILLILNRLGLMSIFRLRPILVLGVSFTTSIVIGVALAAVVTQRFLRPISELSDAVKHVAGGDFSVRVPEHESVGEINELCRSFNTMSGELAGTELFRNDFINNFSHEFKTPIVSIRGFARQLRRGNLSPEIRDEYLEIIETEADRLARMSSNVLLLSKYENLSIVSNITEFSLDEQIRRCILLFEREWTEKKLELEIELEPVTYLFNEEMLSHVWNNLISNAIRFSPPGGTLRIWCGMERGRVTVKVRDCGQGISPESLDRIFDKFYQGDTSHRSEGNGIGLALAKRVVELAGGNILVTSEAGRGSEFTVRLPVRKRAF